MIWDAFKLAEASFAHLALFVLPCSLLLLLSGAGPGSAATLSRRWWCAIVGVSAFLVWWRLWSPDLPIRVFAMAHSVMHGPQPWAPVNEPLAYRRAVWAAEIVATLLLLTLLGGAALRRWLHRVSTDRESLSLAVFAVGVVVALLLPFALAGGFNERYLIPAVPFAILAFVAWCSPEALGSRPTGRAAGAIVSAAPLAAFGLVAVVFAHDYLALNRARWDAAYHLVHERRIDPAHIDGGLAVNGWYLFPTPGPLRDRYVNWKSEAGGWWRNIDAGYIVGIDSRTASERGADGASAGHGPDAQIVYSKDYDVWLPGTSRRVVVCRGAACGAYFRGRDRAVPVQQ